MRQLKGFICGIIFAIGLIAVPAVAETVEKTITVLTDYVTVQIDGETKDVRNFVSEGTTYIALRDVSELFGYEVGWDDATHVASINTGKNPLAAQTAMEVNGEKISAQQFQTMYTAISNYYSGSGITDAEILDAAKEELATQAVVNQKAKQLNAADPEKIREDINAELSAMDMAYSAALVDQMILAQGYNSREEFIQSSVSYTVNQELFAYLEEVEPSYTAVRDGAEEYYETHKEDYKEPSVQVKHILIPTVDLATGAALSEEEQQAAKETAEKIAAEATAENFDDLIAQYNKDSGQPEEGYLVTEDSNFVDIFKTTALALKQVGEISEPVLSNFGYHIIIATQINEYTPYDVFLNSYLAEKYTELDQQFAKQWLDEAQIVYNEDVINSIISK